MPVPQHLIDAGALGEIVSWQVPSGITISIAKMREAITQAGFDPKLAGDFGFLRGFHRAKGTLSKKCVLKIFPNTDGNDTRNLKFQFTQERMGEDKFEYDMAYVLVMDKTNGKVTCPSNPTLAAEAEALIAQCVDERRTSDLTGFVKKVFCEKSDLFPIKSTGGAYFVPQEHVDFLSMAEKFLTHIGGRISRFTVALGGGSIRSVREAMEEGIRRVLDEHVKAVDEFDMTETRESTVQRRADAIEQTRMKVEGYAAYLEEAAAVLADEIDALKAKLAAKLTAAQAEKAHAERTAA